MSFSTRAISWIWNRIVSRFSNTRVTNNPTGIRRRRFSSMMCARKSARSRSYSRRSAMSSMRSLVVVVVIGRATPRRLQLGEALEALGEAAGVGLLGPGQGLEPLGDLVEALVPSGLGEARVHLGVLVGLARDRRLQVVLGGADRLVGHRVAGSGEEVEVA